MKHNFNFAKTCIGSVPYDSSSEIVRYIVKNFKEIPFWPQLAKRSFLESMYVQYASNFPGIVVDENTKKVYFDEKKDHSLEVEQVFNEFLNDNTGYFSIKEEYANGLYSFMSEIKQAVTPELKYLKGHITGPMSFGLSVKDTGGKSIMYYKEFEELIPKFLGMKARWQARELKRIFDRVIIFIDDPYITSIGSSYISVDREKIKESINEIAALIKKEGALSGLHCCGNTEWNFILGTDIDMISFDAHSFMNEFLLYKDDIIKFVNRGGVIAWGGVPTAAESRSAIDPEAIASNISRAVEALEKAGIDREAVIRNSVVTPSCGMGSLEYDQTNAILCALEGTVHKLRQIYKI